MPRTLRYTTFGPGELEARLRELSPNASFTLPTPATSGDSGAGRLLKAHTLCVRFPDDQEGTCRYERGGPRWHLYHYRYADGAELPRQVCLERLGNDVASIEHKGNELATVCYREAILVERKHYFQRASEPSDGSRKRRPERYRFKAERAKELAGKYALCQPSGPILLVVGAFYDDIELANAAWRERGDLRLVVGCCNRLDRCFELPRYNTLYAEHDPRSAFQTRTEESPT